MLQIVHAFDRMPVAEIRTEDATGLEAKLEAATRAFHNRDGWPKTHERIAVLRRLAPSVDHRPEHFAHQIAPKEGKPLSDAIVEVGRAIDSVLNAAEELRTFAGREIPMGLTPASTERWAFTTKEPIGVVVAISAFNHLLNLIVHQVVPRSRSAVR
jgi:acyl-CoA reductase-like NAD-dependent aldehyde dehydrogenase